MPKTDYVLNCGQKDKSIIDDEIILYDKVEDVQGKAYQITFDNKIMYAKYGELNDSKASLISVNIDGIEKALLRTARTIWNFDNVKLRYKEGSASALGSSASLVGKYNPSSDAELQWDVTIPEGVSNVVVKYDWEAVNKPVVTFDWFNHTINLDIDSTATTGHHEYSIPAGSSWDNRVTVMSYDAGIFSKYFYIRNFSIEMDINVPIVEHKFIDNFSTIRQIPVNSLYKATVSNGYCVLETPSISDQPEFIYDMTVHQGFDMKMSFTISELTPGCQVRVRVINSTEERVYDFTTDGTRTITLKPNLDKVSFKLMSGSGTTPVAPFKAKISNVVYTSYWTS